jgi:hypothetical protein
MDSNNENLQKENTQENFENKETLQVQDDPIITPDAESPKNNSENLLVNSISFDGENSKEEDENSKSSDQQVRQRKKGLRSFQKVEEQICASCGTNDKLKLLRCYTCKKLICKICAEKETHYSSKRRDQSSYICANCFENDNPKIR